MKTLPRRAIQTRHPAYELRPVFDGLIANLKRSTKLFMDETRAPVLDLGSRKTKTAWDDRSWGGGAPPDVAFTYAPGRGGIHAERILQGFSGVLQVDGYAGNNRLIGPDRIGPDIQLAYCWAHARRKLVEITRNGSAPIAEDGVKRIGELYRIEAELSSRDPQARLTDFRTHHGDLSKRARFYGLARLGAKTAFERRKAGSWPSIEDEAT